MSEGFKRVTASSPCPICGKDSWCARMARFHLCMRVESNKPCEKGGWLHPLDSTQLPAPLPPRREHKNDQQLDDQFRPIIERAAKCSRARIAELAEKLGVALEPALRLQCGFIDGPSGGYWTFPERNADGLIIGITKRLVTPMADGRNKLCAKGGRRGLVYDKRWIDEQGPVFLVEGGSDTLAGMTIGLCVIGRPSNTGGVDLLVDLLKKRRGKIVVVGENDKKPDGSWPGKTGAIDTAKSLAKRARRAVAWQMPPNGAKDLREYVRSLGLVLSDQRACFDAGRALRNQR